MKKQILILLFFINLNLPLTRQNLKNKEDIYINQISNINKINNIDKVAFIPLPWEKKDSNLELITKNIIQPRKIVENTVLGIVGKIGGFIYNQILQKQSTPIKNVEKITTPIQIVGDFFIKIMTSIFDNLTYGKFWIGIMIGSYGTYNFCGSQQSLLTCDGRAIWEYTLGNTQRQKAIRLDNELKLAMIKNEENQKIIKNMEIEKIKNISYLQNQLTECNKNNELLIINKTYEQQINDLKINSMHKELYYIEQKTNNFNNKINNNLALYEPLGNFNKNNKENSLQINLQCDTDYKISKLNYGTIIECKSTYEYISSQAYYGSLQLIVGAFVIGTTIYYINNLWNAISFRTINRNIIETPTTARRTDSPAGSTRSHDSTSSTGSGTRRAMARFIDTLSDSLVNRVQTNNN